jgi:uncharacterized repeat protein (TIGR02543 family)
MVISVLVAVPITSNAAQTYVQAVGSTYSGTTGSCTWNLNTSTGNLTISGSGAMKDYTSSSSAPWYSYFSYIKTVTISSGVTNIGDYAFYYCTSLKSATIPNSVKSIGSYAFKNCESLTGVRIPSSVKSIESYAFKNCTSITSITISSSAASIGEWAFAYCTSLKSITIPSKSIGDYAFDNCISLTSITIPSSVTSIKYSAFYDCTSLTSITVDSDSSYYSSLDGNLYNKDQTTLIQYAIGKIATSFSIPNTVINIASYAFRRCTKLKLITIPSSMKSIGSYAFYYCTSLTSASIPNSVTSIYSGTFEGCTSLINVSIPSSVTSIESNAFLDCSRLKNVYYTGTKNTWNNISIGSGNSYLTNATIHYDTEVPTVSISSTNNVSNSQIVTLSLSDNIGIAGYYWGTSPSYINNAYTSTSTSVSKTVTDSGTYYLTAEDTSGNVSTTQSITFYETTLNANGGTVDNTTILTKSGNSFTPLIPTRSDYAFNGWATSRTATSGSTSITPTSDRTYYATWYYAPAQKLTQKITAKSYKKTYGSKAFNLSAKTNGDGMLTYSSSNKKVVTVSAKGKVTIKGCGKATITIKAAETLYYESATKKVTITVSMKPVDKNSIKLKASSASKVHLSWSKSPKATGYQIIISSVVKGERRSSDNECKNNKCILNIGSGKKGTITVEIRSYVKIGKKKYYSSWVTKKISVL